METIRAYIDQMFKDLPKSKEVVEMKLNILDHMEEKFNELVMNGTSEIDASRIVIAEFGNMDEIMQELGIDFEKATENINYLDDFEVDRVLAWREKFAWLIAIATFFCINAVGTTHLVEWFFPSEISKIIMPITFFGLAAIGAAIFIFAGIKEEKHSKKLELAVISETMKAKLSSMEDAKKTKLIIQLVLGIILCIMSVACYRLFERIVNAGFANFMFFFMISIGVLCIIHSGIQMGTWDSLLRSKTLKEVDDEKFSEKASGVIMMGATGIYLICGFVLGAWGTAWIVFPIGGILCGIVNIVKGVD